MKTRLFLALFFTCCSQILSAQTEKDEPKPEPPKQEKPDANPPKKDAQPKQDKVDPPKKEAKPNKDVKAVPVTKERKSKPAKVSGPRNNGARPAKKGKPAGRPVKPGNGRK